MDKKHQCGFNEFLPIDWSDLREEAKKEIMKSYIELAQLLYEEYTAYRDGKIINGQGNAKQDNHK